MDGEKTTVEGVLERIVFFNEENCYCIAVMRPTSKGFPPGPITVAGTLPSVQCGETLRVSGTWVSRGAYGMQLKVESFESRLPSSIYGIEKFLGSGLVEGIGGGFAKKIVERFGEDTLRIIDSESARLREIRGIGEERSRRIKKSWEEQKNLRDIVIFLRTYGVGMSMCVRIIRRFGDEAGEIVRSSPYRLAREIDGIGFATADRIALNMGIPNESPERIDAGVMHVVRECELDGNTCVPRGELVARASALLDADAAKCAEGVERMLASGELKARGSRVQSGALDYAERAVAENLERIASAPSGLVPIKVGAAVKWAMDRAGFEFSGSQASAVARALESKVCVVTGGPGTGKTTILRALCDILKAKKCSVMLAAPTGRAAQRMSESAGVEAGTIHRMFGYGEGKRAQKKGERVSADFVIIDEASMLDTRLAAAVASAVPDGAHLLLVGDADQLPSVGPGNVLRDITDSGRFPVVRLDRVFRQRERSSIVSVAHAILEGDDCLRQIPPKALGEVAPDSDIQFVYAPEPADCLKACVDLVCGTIPKLFGCDPVSDVQLLAPMHRGAAGVQSFNAALKSALNGNAPAARCGAAAYSVGDKVIQTRNNYELEIFNGDMGRIVSIGDSVAVDFDGRRVALQKSDLVDVQQAYAITIHKSQGSEFPVVVVPFLRQHFMMLQRNLAYTAITRARKAVFIVGDPRAWKLAVSNSRSAARDTLLAERLRRPEEARQWG